MVTADPFALNTARRTNFRWLILALIMLAGFVSYILRTNVSVIGEAMITDLGLSEIQFGAILSAFAVGYAIFQFPGGIFGDKVGSRFALTAAAIGWGVLTVAIAMVPDSEAVSIGVVFWTLIVIRFLVGVTHAPLFPVTGGGVVSRWFPVGHWGLPNGLSSTGLTLGAAASAPLLVWLMARYGWRGSLLITAPIAFVFAVAWWYVVRVTPKEHPLVGAEELSLINAGRSPSDSADEDKGSWKIVIRNREILLLTSSYFCMNYVFYIFFGWFFYFLVDVKGFAQQEAGNLFAMLWIIGAVGATAGGFTCDRLIGRFGSRWGPAILAGSGLALSAVFLVAGAIAADPYAAVILLCICFGCNQLTEAAHWAAAITVAGKRAAAATGVMNTGGNIVGAVSGLLVPFTAEWIGWVAAISTGAVFAIIGALLWLIIRSDRPMDDPRKQTLS